MEYKTKEIRIGDVRIGNKNPIAIQSMTNTDTKNVFETVKQIRRLITAGCEIVRVSIPDIESAKAIAKIKEEINIPIVADIHFDYMLAISAIEYGADKIRINPGNIGKDERLKKVVNVAQKREIPIRVGVNGGSLEKSILNKYGKVTPEAIFESAKESVSSIERLGYSNIVVSIKSSNVLLNYKANKLFAQNFQYPLHIGITESGFGYSGVIKSSIGIGMLLKENIGDTIRVSLTEDPVNEIYCAKDILRTLGIRNDSIEIISCPTCARTKVDLIKIVKEVKSKLKDINKPIKVAVMGCIVNGPGEAKEADIGIAGGVGEFILFKKGKAKYKVKESEVVNKLIEEIKRM